MEEIILFTRTDTIKGIKQISADQVVVETYAALTKNLTLRESNCSAKITDEVDGTFGRYPFMVYKHWFITSNSLAEFLEKATNIDSSHTLTSGDVHKIKHLKHLLIARLSSITKLNSKDDSYFGQIKDLFTKSLFSKAAVDFEREILAFQSPEHRF